MKTPFVRVLIVIGFGLLAGCVSQTLKEYSAIKTGMTRAEVVARLGQPARTSGPYMYWVTDVHTNLYIYQAIVKFDANDRVVETRVWSRRPSEPAHTPDFRDIPERYSASMPN